MVGCTPEEMGLYIGLTALGAFVVAVLLMILLYVLCCCCKKCCISGEKDTFELSKDNDYSMSKI